MVSIDAFVKLMEVGPKNFMLTNEGNIDKFLWTEITYLDHRGFKKLHPFLIEKIILFPKIDLNDYGVGMNSKSTPVGKPLLYKDLSRTTRKETWKYRTEFGMLTYLQGNSRPEMSMVVHQTEQFFKKPNLSHKQAIKQLGQYLLNTKIDGIVYNPYITKELEFYVDADFSVVWQKQYTSNANNVMSRTGMAIMYTNCPIYCCSALQTDIALSTAEVK